MMGLFTGRPGARGWRRMLSEGASKTGADSSLVLEALAQLEALADHAEAV
jgi:tRNA-dihydrouridine synthase A